MIEKLSFFSVIPFYPIGPFRRALLCIIKNMVWYGKNEENVNYDTRSKGTRGLLGVYLRAVIYFSHFGPPITDRPKCKDHRAVIIPIKNKNK